MSADSTLARKTIYVISPFRLEDYVVNWKLFYAGELFSTFAIRGYRVVWIQPGKKCSLSIFPSFHKIWKFTVIELGNYFLFSQLVLFFISRLTKVTKEKKPLIFFELVDGNPLGIQMNPKDFILFPVVFTLNTDRWRVFDNPPTPVFVVDKMSVRGKVIKSRDRSLKGDNFVLLPWGFRNDLKEPSNIWSANRSKYCGDSVYRKIFVYSRKNSFIRKLIGRRMQSGRESLNKSLIQINLEELSLIERVLFVDYFIYLQRMGVKFSVWCIDLWHILYQLSKLGIECWGLVGNVRDMRFWKQKDWELFNEDCWVSGREIMPLSCVDNNSKEKNSDYNSLDLSWDYVMREMIEWVLKSFVKE